MEEQRNEIPNMNQAEVNIGIGMNGATYATNGIGTNGGEYVGTGIDAVNGVANTEEANGAAWSKANLPAKVGFWSKLKSFLLTEIKVELTPKQQKVEREINEFLFQEIHIFGKKKNVK